VDNIIRRGNWLNLRLSASRNCSQAVSNLFVRVTQEESVKVYTWMNEQYVKAWLVSAADGLKKQ
jgi:hypothetical protein